MAKSVLNQGAFYLFAVVNVLLAFAGTAFLLSLETVPQMLAYLALNIPLATLLFLAASMGVIGMFKKETTVPILLNQSMIFVGAAYGVPAVYAEMLTLT